MSDETSAPAGGEPIAVITPAADTGTDLSVSQAARALQAARKPKEPAAESAPEATAEPELAQASDDPETAPIEATDEAEPAEVPPIEPPRSWTKAEKERFQSLPRETQEYLHSREQERERDFRRSQNEIADQRKAIQAEREAAEKVRQQYEAKLPALEKKLQTVGPFADVQSMEDLKRMQAEDPFRFQQYQLYVWEQQAEQSELQAAESRKAQEQQTEWAHHVQKENELAAEYIPELADKEKGPALTKRVATELLPELGFKDSELNDLASGKSRLSIYDHRVQRLIADALKLRDIQSAKTAVTAKPLPPVLRPGTAKPSSNAATERAQALDKSLSSSGSLKDAIALRALQAKRRA